MTSGVSRVFFIFCSTPSGLNQIFSTTTAHRGAISLKPIVFVSFLFTVQDKIKKDFITWSIFPLHSFSCWNVYLSWQVKMHFLASSSATPSFSTTQCMFPICWILPILPSRGTSIIHSNTYINMPFFPERVTLIHLVKMGQWVAVSHSSTATETPLRHGQIIFLLLFPSVCHASQHTLSCVCFSLVFKYIIKCFYFLLKIKGWKT